MTVQSMTTVVGVIAVVTVVAAFGTGTGVTARQAESVWDGIYTEAQAARRSTSRRAPSAMGPT